MQRKNVEDALTWVTGANENSKPNDFVYKDIMLGRDLLLILAIDGYFQGIIHLVRSQNFLKNWHFLRPVTLTYVFVLESKKCFFQ